MDAVVSFWRLGVSARLGAARQFYFWPRRLGAREAAREIFFFCRPRRSRRRGENFVSWRPFFCIPLAEPRAWLQRLLLEPSSGAAAQRDSGRHEPSNIHTGLYGRVTRRPCRKRRSSPARGDGAMKALRQRHRPAQPLAEPFCLAFLLRVHGHQSRTGTSRPLPRARARARARATKRRLLFAMHESVSHPLLPLVASNFQILTAPGCRVPDTEALGPRIAIGTGTWRRDLAAVQAGQGEKLGAVAAPPPRGRFEGEKGLVW